MSVKDDYINFKDPYGMVHPTPTTDGDHSQNGPRFTGEYVQALVNAGELDDATKIELRNTLDVLQEEPGNLLRYPGWYEQQSVDDTMAALYWSTLVGGDYAQNWLEYGVYNAPTKLGHGAIEDKPWFRNIVWPLLKFFKLHRYTYNTAEPGVFTLDAWIGRQQQIIAHAQIVLGRKVNLFRKLWWAATIMLTVKRRPITDQDAWVLSWYLVKAARNYPSRIIQWARRKWIAKFKELCPKGLGDVIAGYSGPQNPSGRHLLGEHGE